MIHTEQARMDAVKFLRKNVTAVIASSFNDEPSASTVYYYMDDSFNFYFTTKRNTGKYKNLEMNPKVAIVVGTGPEHISVQASGTAELIVEDADKEKILATLMSIKEREHIEVWPIEQMNNFKDRNKVVFKISPEKVTFMNLDSSEYPDSISPDYAEVFPSK